MGVGVAVDAAGGFGFGQHGSGNAQKVGDISIPLEGVDIEEHRTGCRGDLGDEHSAMGQFPDQPGIQRTGIDPAAVDIPFDAFHIVDDPFDLRRGKITVYNEACFLANHVAHAFLDLVCIFRSPPVLPDDSIVYRLSRNIVPKYYCLPLIVDSQTTDIIHGNLCL